MLRPEDIYGHLRERPFQPFRIYLTDGSTYDIRHPEMLIVGDRKLFVGLTNGNRAREFPVADRVVTVALLHVTRLEPLPSPTPTTPPGDGR